MIETCPECEAITEENEDGLVFCPECGWIEKTDPYEEEEE